MVRRIRRGLRRTYRGRRSRAGARRVARSRAVGARRYARSYRSRAFARMSNPLAFNRFRTKLTYYDTQALDPASNALTTINGSIWQYRANSVFDPDYTGVGHQPMYFDNLAAIYQNYRVLGCKITVTVVDIRQGGVVPEDANNQYYHVLAETLRLAIIRDENFEIPNDMRNLIETRGSNIKWRWVSPSMNGRLASLSHYCSPSKQMSLPRNDNTLSATVTANPERQAVFTIAIASADGLANPPYVTVAIKLEYDVEFFNRQLTLNQN